MQNRYLTIDEGAEANFLLKRGIWLYFLLLIFEGALRKWVLPGLAAPLLVVRDPIAIWLIYTAWKNDLMPVSALLSGMIAIGILSIFTALLFGHGNLIVALYGARILLIHFPLIFVIGQVFDRNDVLHIGKVLLWISIPMAILVAFQFYSPQTAIVNRGVGGDTGGAGFTGAMGYFRPPATFSFTNGTHLFFGLCASYIIYFLMNPKSLTGLNKFMLYGATIALVAVIPLSISRSLTFTVGLILAFALFSMARKPENLIRVAIAGGGIGLVILLLYNFQGFRHAVDAFTFRFTSASTIEGGLTGTFGGRYFGWMFSALSTASQQPFFGLGLGMGTNAGSMLLSGGRKFLVAEEEWNRQIGELGALLGIALIGIRVVLSLKMVVFSFKHLQNGDLLPWLLLGYGLTIIPQGQWAQPTTLGFSALIGGLIIASMNPAPEQETEDELKLSAHEA